MPTGLPHPCLRCPHIFQSPHLCKPPTGCRAALLLGTMSGWGRWGSWAAADLQSHSWSVAETHFQPSVRTQNPPLAVGNKVCESFDPPCPLPHMVRISNTTPTDLSAHWTSLWTLRVNAAGSLLPSGGAQTQSLIEETPRCIGVRVEVQKLGSVAYIGTSF